MAKRTEIGLVTSDRCAKTRRVEIPRLVQHPKYGKFLRRRTICHVHDEAETSRMGDTVEIVECRPRSKTKRWELVRVISHGADIDKSRRYAAGGPEAEIAGTEQAPAANA